MCGSCHLDGSSYFEIGIKFWNVYLLFLFFAGSKRRTNWSAIFSLKSPNLFYILKVPKNTFHAVIKETNDSIFDTKFNIQPLSKWHDLLINLLRYLLWWRCDPLCLQNLPFHLHNLPLHNYLHPDLVLQHIHRIHHLCQLYRGIYAAIICHNDELSSSLSWLKIVYNSVFW